MLTDSGGYQAFSLADRRTRGEDGFVFRSHLDGSRRALTAGDAGLRYLSRSTRTSEHTTTWEDGNVYPVVEVDLSSAAHLARQQARHPQRELAGAAA